MMDNAKAKAVLVEMLGANAVRPDELDKLTPYVCCRIPDDDADEGEELGVTLDASFTADQLEAIAAWMRDPKGVSEA